MGRRTNKSAKVPNVKLRPAAPCSLARTEEPTWLAQDTQVGTEGELGPIDLCYRPFKGFVICATGIVDKPTLFKQALELGATSTSPFTDCVTHLVAAHHGGSKYKCALERKIPILKASWIEESYNIWLKGDDVDVAESVEAHRLPIFSGVVLCLSGVDDILRRTRINKLVTKQKGTYIKNLERPVKVTHLLCSGDEQTEKMRYAEKFNKRGEANIHIVWEEWFWDSLEFGGRFEEEKYQVSHPRPERKQALDSPSCPPPSSPVEPSRSEPAERTEDDNEEEVASIKRIPDMTLQLWESLLKPRGFEITAGKLLRSPSKSQGDSKFHGDHTSPPFRRTLSTLVKDAGDGPNGAGPSRETSKLSFPASGLFKGCKFRVLADAQSYTVREPIENSGGELVMDESVEDVDYVLVRLASGSHLYRAEADAEIRDKYRTECWMEQCIHEERICSAEDHVTFTPLKIDLPVPDADSVNLRYSGLDAQEACWIRRLARALGIVLAPAFSRHATHLLCPSGTGAKFEKAREWGVPVVNMAWLAEMATTGSVPPVADYLVLTMGDNDSSGMVDAGGVGGGAEEGSDLSGIVEQGKGKERAAEHQMVDITNSDSYGEIHSLPNTQTHEPKEPKKTSVEREKTSHEIKTVGFDLFQGSQTRDERHSTRTLTSTPPCAPTSQEHVARTSSFPKLVHVNATAGPSRSKTIADIELLSRVPSSKSPSPMKIPPNKIGAHDAPVQVPNELTKALQDSITSLLGKREPSDEDENVARAAKRSRPHTRSKPQSRQPSALDMDIAKDTVVPVEPYIPYEPYDELNITDGESTITEQSIRVMYEDPGQRDEQHRLMSLFESGAGLKSGRGGRKGAANPGRTTRRSTRIGGL